MAVLNREYYDGNNHYSDGSIEDEILDILKEGREVSKGLSKQDQYALYYHLSPLRENILNWYPFEKGCKVLEIGSGCGAITGLLCKKARKVVSVELSQKRAEINYERNKSFDNLEIVVGNMNDIALDKDFDYIILNGVLEYAISFTYSNNPYVDFLKNLLRFIKTDGKLLVAIENRLGCKYFSGSYEDHTNTFFLGLNQYAGNNTVRTFSKTELSELLIASGFKAFRFYYPYPDYKFPIEVFSDEIVNNGQYGRKIFNPEKERFVLFDEKKVLDSFSKEQIVDVFANSFFVEASPHKLINNYNVLYAKMNTSRKECFRTNTLIIEDRKERKVIKTIGHISAIEHLDTIIKNENTLIETGYNYLRGEKLDNGIIYPYVEEENLAEEILDLIRKKNIQKIKEIIRDVIEVISVGGENRSDFYTEEFEEYFGTAKSDKDFLCVRNQNIDIICNNIYRIDEQYLFIDGEWVCHFWVPVDFIVWRLINELFSAYPELYEHISPDNFFAEFEISTQSQDVFLQWAIHFAERFVGDNRQPSFCGNVYPISLNECLKEHNARDTVLSGLYIDDGDGFSEGNKLCKEINIKNGHFNISFDLSKHSSINSLRWDPVEGKSCRCVITECMIDGEVVKAIPLNSELFDKSIFISLDPQIRIEHLKKEDNFKMTIQGELSILGETDLLQLYGYNADRLQCHINALSSANKTYCLESQQLQHDLQILTTQNIELSNRRDYLENIVTGLQKQVLDLQNNEKSKKVIHWGLRLIFGKVRVKIFKLLNREE